MACLRRVGRGSGSLITFRSSFVCSSQEGLAQEEKEGGRELVCIPAWKSTMQQSNWRSEASSARGRGEKCRPTAQVEPGSGEGCRAFGIRFSSYLPLHLSTQHKQQRTTLAYYTTAPPSLPPSSPPSSSKRDAFQALPLALVAPFAHPGALEPIAIEYEWAGQGVHAGSLYVYDVAPRYSASERATSTLTDDLARAGRAFRWIPCSQLRIEASQGAHQGTIGIGREDRQAGRFGWRC